MFVKYQALFLNVNITFSPYNTPNFNLCVSSPPSVSNNIRFLCGPIPTTGNSTHKTSSMNNCKTSSFGFVLLYEYDINTLLGNISSDSKLEDSKVSVEVVVAEDSVVAVAEELEIELIEVLVVSEVAVMEEDEEDSIEKFDSEVTEVSVEDVEELKVEIVSDVAVVEEDEVDVTSMAEEVETDISDVAVGRLISVVEELE